MALPRRLTDVDAAGRRSQPGAFTHTAAELKVERIKAYARAFQIQAPLQYDMATDEDLEERDE